MANLRTNAPMHFIRAALLTLLAAIFLPMGAMASQRTDQDPAVLLVVDTALNAAQSGDVKTLREQYTDDCTFIDEFAPFIWSGPGALDGYFASAARMFQETRHTDVTMTKGSPKYVYVTLENAYVIEPMTEKATVGGKPYSSSGLLAFTLTKTASGWKIKSQTWAKSDESMNPY